MHIPSLLRTTGLAAASLLALGLAACLETPQGPGIGPASTMAPNRYGYGGTVTDPTGMVRQPSAGPDGALAQAMTGQPPTGTLAQANQPQTPSPTLGNLSQPVLPTVDPNPPRPPDTGVNPKVSPTPPTPPAAGTPTGTGQNPPPAPPSATKKTDYPYGIPVPGKDGLVYSPYDQKAGYVDVRGMKPGSLVECPYSKKYFRVP